jgi:hypothetical protein
VLIERPCETTENSPRLIAPLVTLANVVGVLLNALGILLAAYEACQQPTIGDIERLAGTRRLWREQLERRRPRLASVMMEPPGRAQ